MEMVIKDAAPWLLIAWYIFMYVVAFWVISWVWMKIVGFFSYSKETVDSLRYNSEEQTHHLRTLTRVEHKDPFADLNEPASLEEYRDRLNAENLIRDIDSNKK